MKGYVSLLKGTKFRKNSNLKSLFLLQKPQEEKEKASFEVNDNLLPNISQAKNVIMESKKMMRLIKRKSRMSKIYEDYEDLFFYLLKHPKKIEALEAMSSKKKIGANNTEINKDTYESESEDDFIKASNNIDIKKIFYKKIFLGLMEENKLHWENFYFPKSIFRIIYKKSKAKQKDILNFINKYELQYDTVVNSYEKIYTNKTKKKNWDLEPLTAYNNYLEIFYKNNNLVKSKEMEKDLKESKDIMLRYEALNKFNKDIVVKTNNKGNGKTLIFNGKLLNVYVDDYLRKNNESHIISINSPNQKKKEIIYSAKDLLPELRQNFSFDKNNFLNQNKYNPIMTQKSFKSSKKNLGNLSTRDFIKNKIEHKNKRSGKNIKINNKINTDLIMNKFSFSPELSNPLVSQESYKCPNLKGDSSNLILNKIKNRNHFNINGKKGNLFAMFKFSYY